MEYPVKLKQLLKGIEEIEVRGSREVEISGLTSDSRTVSPGHLFIAKKGLSVDGAQFLEQASQAGATALLTDFYNPFLKATQILHTDPARLEAKFADRFYGSPSQELFVVGVTGTKGKTTTTYLARHLLEALGLPCGLIGTIETIAGKERRPSQLTTHDAIYNQKHLREMVDRGCKAAVLEVSSHGLVQGRVDEIAFDAAIFTNLYPDHLDYHKTMEAYAAAKKNLLLRAEKAVIVNGDTSWTSSLKVDKETWTFCLQGKGDVVASEIALNARGAKVWVEAKGEKALVETPLLGVHNVANLLAALSLGLFLGAPLSQLASLFASFPDVSGRLERIANDRGIEIFVDYAHTKESLAHALQSLKEVARRKVLVLFGCGGNRDPARRPGMAEAAEALADQIWVTTDNPRQEDPLEIARQILAGFQRPEKVFCEPDRKKAIFQILSFAKEGDIVLIAGKGHEKVQIFAHQTVPFDDVAVAKEALLCDAFKP